MHALIIYYSKYGSTRQYAEWLQEETGADILPVEEAESVNYTEYDCLVFGSFVMAGKPTMKICNLIVSNWKVLKDKKIALYSVSGESPWGSKTQAAYQRSLPEEYRRGIAFFSFGGRVHLKSMKFLDRLALRLIGTAELDEVKRDSIKPLVKFIRTGKR